jgi:hypothetical protein
LASLVATCDDEMGVDYYSQRNLISISPSSDSMWDWVFFHILIDVFFDVNHVVFMFDDQELSIKRPSICLYDVVRLIRLLDEPITKCELVQYGYKSLVYKLTK